HECDRDRLATHAPEVPEHLAVDGGDVGHWGRQSSVASCQLPVASCQLPVASCQAVDQSEPQARALSPVPCPLSPVPCPTLSPVPCPLSPVYPPVPHQLSSCGVFRTAFRSICVIRPSLR